MLCMYQVIWCETNRLWGCIALPGVGWSLWIYPLAFVCNFDRFGFVNYKITSYYVTVCNW